MNTQLVDQHWFISLNGKRYGPYTFAALVEAAGKGVVTSETSVWRLGWQQWHPASQVPGLLGPAQPAAATEAPDSAARDDEGDGARDAAPRSAARAPERRQRRDERDE